MRLIGTFLAALPLTLAASRSHLDIRNAPCLDEGARIIAISGHGAPVHNGYGLLDTTVESILDAIPGSSNISLPFPKNDNDTGEAVRTGQLNLQKKITSYAGRCEDTPIVLVGYSEGAIITMNTLCGSSQDPTPYNIPLPSQYTQNIIAIVVYGDETRAPGQSYDKGTCHTGQGVASRNNSDACAPYAPSIHSYCDMPDPQCCGGDNQSVHYTYANTYNTKATNFIVKKYDAYKDTYYGK